MRNFIFRFLKVAFGTIVTAILGSIVALFFLRMCDMPKFVEEPIRQALTIKQSWQYGMTEAEARQAISRFREFEMRKGATQARFNYEIGILQSERNELSCRTTNLEAFCDWEVGEDIGEVCSTELIERHSGLDEWRRAQQELCPPDIDRDKFRVAEIDRALLKLRSERSEEISIHAQQILGDQSDDAEIQLIQSASWGESRLSAATALEDECGFATDILFSRGTTSIDFTGRGDRQAAYDRTLQNLQKEDRLKAFKEEFCVSLIAFRDQGSEDILSTRLGRRMDCRMYSEEAITCQYQFFSGSIADTPYAGFGGTQAKQTLEQCIEGVEMSYEGATATASDRGRCTLQYRATTDQLALMISDCVTYRGANEFHQLDVIREPSRIE